MNNDIHTVPLARKLNRAGKGERKGELEGEPGKKGGLWTLKTSGKFAV